MCISPSAESAECSDVAFQLTQLQSLALPKRFCWCITDIARITIGVPCNPGYISPLSLRRDDDAVGLPQYLSTRLLPEPRHALCSRHRIFFAVYKLVENGRRLGIASNDMVFVAPKRQCSARPNNPRQLWPQAVVVEPVCCLSCNNTVDRFVGYKRQVFRAALRIVILWSEPSNFLACSTMPADGSSAMTELKDGESAFAINPCPQPRSRSVPIGDEAGRGEDVVAP